MRLKYTGRPCSESGKSNGVNVVFKGRIFYNKLMFYVSSIEYRAFSVLPSHHDTLSYSLFGAHMCQSLLKQHVLALPRMNMRRQTSDVKLSNLSARKTIQIIGIVLLHLLKTHALSLIHV